MISIERAPAYATVQDLGRTGFREVGVPAAGAMDAVALAALNLLVGNDRNAAGLEIALTGGVLVFEDSAVFSLGGASANAMLGPQLIEPYKAFRAQPGDRLTIENISAGRFVYAAFRGGLEIETVLASSSTYLPGSFGGAGGRRLKSGDTLEVGVRKNRGGQVADSLPVSLRPPADSAEIRFVPRGAESSDEIAGRYTLSASSDRTGYRLEGFRRDNGASVTSEPVCFGAIQLPPGGEPIILMADSPTIGGYRLMGGVISADLGMLAQKLPGGVVDLVPVTLEHARRELERLAEVEGLITEWCLN